MSYLDLKFIETYDHNAPAWKNNPLGELVCRRTYCRVKDNGEYESWRDIITRVVNGCYDLQRHHVEKNGLGWVNEKGCTSAQEMFDKMYNMKFSPPGRGLWTMGTDITKKKGIYAALNNCGFTSTGDIREKGSEPFRFLMDMCMLGVGVGFDVKGGYKANNVENATFIRNLKAVQLDEIQVTWTNNTPQKRIERTTKFEYVNIYKDYLRAQIKKAGISKENAEKNGDAHFANESSKSMEIYSQELSYVESLPIDQIQLYKIEDTREGWVNSTGAIIDSYIGESSTELRDDQNNVEHDAQKRSVGLERRRSHREANAIIFYYGDIREAGQILKTFGGVSSGPEPLLDLHIMIRKLLQRQSESEVPYVTETIIVDLMNLIGRCVVAGNVRRSSEISLGSYESEEFINLKNYKINPEREAWGWCSNNSIFADVGMDYKDIEERIANNGEPGLLWMDNVRKFSRMNGVEDNKDFRADGTNPCSEQTLEDKELCCLVEVFIANHDSLEEFLRTLKFAYLYAKTVTLGDSHWVATNRVMMRNRRIGCSLTGLVQFLAKWDIDTLKTWLDAGYDEIQKWDRIYSDWFAIPRSIKTTSIKPSGCLTEDTMVRTYNPTTNTDKNMTIGNISKMYGLIKPFDDIEMARNGVYVYPEEKTFHTLSEHNNLFIYNKDNVPEKVTKLYYNGMAEVYEIPIEGGVVRCTAEHKFLLSDGTWKAAVDLRAGDDIVSYVA